MTKYIVWFILSSLFIADKSITGKVVKVTDGDTVTLLTSNNKQEKVRLDGIDAPEKGQDFGEKSRQYLALLVAGKTVRVKYKRKDRYGRILGTVYVGNLNVNEEMIRKGLAWQYYYNKNKHYRKLQTIAKAEKLNIWSAKNPVNPYDYRKNRKRKKLKASAVKADKYDSAMSIRIIPVKKCRRSTPGKVFKAERSRFEKACQTAIEHEKCSYGFVKDLMKNTNYL
jgi:endonuclease YncB( thermonuclease family)